MARFISVAVTLLLPLVLVLMLLVSLLLPVVALWYEAEYALVLILVNYALALNLLACGASQLRENKI